MPAKSKSQQQAAAIALAVKHGKLPESKLRGASKKMYDSMIASDLEEFVGTKTKKLPMHKKKKK